MPLNFHIITSNQMEVLSQGLAELLRSTPEGRAPHPLHTELVIVQSKGMQRWVSTTIARINGVCANVDFPFPNAFLDRLYGHIVRPIPDANPYDPNALTFRIFSLLPSLLGLSEFEPLRIYLSDHPSPLKQFQLSSKLADMFDQYAVFRPDMLLSWEAGPKAASLPAGFAWQAVLWCRLVADIQALHRPALHMELIDQLINTASEIPMDRLPARIALFGISHLPPYHLQAIEALAHRIPVYFFILNPCRHFWFDIVSDHQMIRQRAGKEQRDAAEQLHMERGNRLLSSLGLLGQQFFNRVFQSDAQVSEAFQDQPRNTLLGSIQQDILDLVDRPQAERTTSQSPIRADGSLRIHSCHSPMREVEILYDQLLDMLANDRELQPRDILVMAPNINLYAPYIHAVFGAAQNEHTRIPFSVADQSILQESPVAQVFVQFLDLVGGRFEVSHVMALLENPAVHQRFGFTSAELPIVERWIQSVCIRWGWDGEDRRRLGLPGYRENTWRTGLDRLVMGYALAPEQDRLFSGILPYEGIGSGEGHLVGKLVAFAEAVHESLNEMEVNDSLEGWHGRLIRLIDRFFLSNDQTEQTLQALRAVIDRLKEIGRATMEATPFAIEVVRALVKHSLRRVTHDAGFMSGGITFCAMLPMRSIPAQVICLLGMNHDAYPREQREPGFNLIATDPRPGDRSRRLDDRYLFLETLISARKTLYISYVGQDIQDNTPIPPAVVVDELVEYAMEGFGIASGALVTIHSLHGFAPAYFNNSQPHLFSYSKENKEAARQLASEGEKRLFFKESLAPPEAHWRRCEWGRLAAFFAHPTRYLMEQRSGVYLRTAADPIEDRESFMLEALERYRINQKILSALLAGKTSEHSYHAIRASGMLPHGTVGKVFYKRLNDEVEEYLRTMIALIPHDEPRNAPIEVEMPPFSIGGSIDALYPQARIVCLLANVRPKDLLNAFIGHLGILLAPLGDLPKTTILVCKNAIWRFGPVEESESILRDYLTLYWQGMQKPLRFFCRTSFEYAHARLIKGRSLEVATAAASNVWFGNDFLPGESADPYYKICFNNGTPLGYEFENVAMRVFGTLLTVGEQLPADG
ncbi:MAG: exodeoxyribonuclease V subunit gamma [Desulfatitalea sp.]